LGFAPHNLSLPPRNYSANLKLEAVMKMEDEQKPQPMEEEREPEPTEDEDGWELEPMGYIIIRRVFKGAIDNQLHETGDLIIDPTKIDGFFLCDWDGEKYQPKEGEVKFPIYPNMHFDLLPRCRDCEQYFFVTPTKKRDYLASRRGN
jgi:hypothetical protein